MVQIVEEITIITIWKRKYVIIKLTILVIGYNKDKLMNDGRLDPLWNNINGG